MSPRTSSLRGLLLLVSVTLADCHRHRAETDPGADPGSAAHGDDPDTEARMLYASRCVMCHGVNGAGDGPTAAVLNPRPRNFRDPAWQATVTDAQIEAIVVRGGQGVGRSTAMPPFPALADRPALRTAIRALVRGFGTRPDQ